MTTHEISRRQLAQYGLGMAAVAGLTSLPGIQLVPAARAQESSGADSPFSDESSFAASVNKAYSFLNAMMDA